MGPRQMQNGAPPNAKWGPAKFNNLHDILQTKNWCTFCIKCKYLRKLYLSRWLVQNLKNTILEGENVIMAFRKQEVVIFGLGEHKSDLWNDDKSP